MKTLSFILMFVLGINGVSATGPTSKKLPVKIQAPLSFGIGLNLGVIPGVDAGLQITPFVGARVKVGYFRYNDFPYDVYVQSVKLQTFTSLKLGAVEVVADIFPFASGLFRITGGLAIFTDNTISMRGYLGEPIYYQGQEIRPEDVGYMDADVHWSRTGAYLGIGMGRPAPARRVGLGFDLGVYYMGKPQATVNYTDEPEPELQAALQEYVKPYRFLPYLNLRIGFRLVP